MYVMRPGDPADADGITHVLDERFVHHWKRHGHGIPELGDRLRRLLLHPGQGGERVWVFTDDSARCRPLAGPAARYEAGTRGGAPVVGCLTLSDQLPEPQLWTTAEGRETALSIPAFYSHPGPQLRCTGALMHWWILDHVARSYPQADWLRCVVPHTRLMRHLRDRYGWEYVRSAAGSSGSAVHLMQRRPHAQQGLSLLITTAETTPAPGSAGVPSCDAVRESS
ncbi:hypothetical protein ACFWXK_22760 [Streptomyces sp. NPDC059070]|uniref:hypothetical protein n=1 Tax=Streptomyces sp. NPDC059070 TaxID=3346713 RepID=UPI0036A6CF48